MPSDRSQTERIRHLRGKIQAIVRIECKKCLEEGPRGPVDESTRLSRMFGQQIYYRHAANGEIITESVAPSK